MEESKSKIKEDQRQIVEGVIREQKWDYDDVVILNLMETKVSRKIKAEKFH